MAGFHTPAELVAVIGQMGDPDRSCALLAELLTLAATDTIAARAVLQAVLPGLRQAARRHWRPPAGGPWASLHELHLDTVSMGWEAIHAHRGQRHDRPAKIIVRDAEARLRQPRDRWTRQASAAVTHSGGPAETTQSGADAAFSAECQATAIIADAMHAGVLDPAQAALTLTIGVLGYTISDAGRLATTQLDDPYRALHRARATLRAWIDDRPEATTPVDVHRERPASTRQHATSKPTQARPFTADPQSIDPAGVDRAPAEPGGHPLLLSPIEAARQLSVSRSKLYTLIKRGQIDTVRSTRPGASPTASSSPTSTSSDSPATTASTSPTAGQSNPGPFRPQ